MYHIFRGSREIGCVSTYRVAKEIKGSSKRVKIIWMK
jgi:hypothetical protein